MRIAKYNAHGDNPGGVGQLTIHLTLSERDNILRLYGERLMLDEINSRPDWLIIRPDSAGNTVQDKPFNVRATHELMEYRLGFTDLKLGDLFGKIPAMSLTFIPEYQLLDEGVAIKLPTQYMPPKVQHRLSGKPRAIKVAEPEYTLEKAARFLESELARMDGVVVTYEDKELVISTEVTQTITRRELIYGS